MNSHPLVQISLGLGLLFMYLGVQIECLSMFVISIPLITGSSAAIFHRYLQD